MSDQIQLSPGTVDEEEERRKRVQAAAISLDSYTRGDVQAAGDAMARDEEVQRNNPPGGFVPVHLIPPTQNQEAPKENSNGFIPVMNSEDQRQRAEQVAHIARAVNTYNQNNEISLEDRSAVSATLSALTGIPYRTISTNLETYAEMVVGKSTTPRNLFQIVFDGWKDGRVGADIASEGSRMLANVIAGQDIGAYDRHRLEYLEKIRPDIDYESLPFVQEMLARTAQQLRQTMIPAAATGVGVGVAAVGATAAVASTFGAATPAIAAAMGSAWTIGRRTGSFASMARASAGSHFLQLINMTDEEGNQIDPRIAAGHAIAVGAIEGALEQVGAENLPLMRFISGSGADQVVRNTIAGSILGAARSTTTSVGSRIASVGASVLRRTAGGTAAEIATEVSQEIVGIFSEEIAKAAARGSGFSGGDFDPASGVDVVARMAETIRATAMTTATLGLLGAPFEVSQDLRSLNDTDIRRSRTIERLKSAASIEPVTSGEVRQVLARDQGAIQSVLEKVNQGESVTDQEFLAALGAVRRVEFLTAQREGTDGTTRTVEPVSFAVDQRVSDVIADEQIRTEIKSAFEGMTDQEVDASIMVADFMARGLGQDTRKFLSGVRFTGSAEVAMAAGVSRTAIETGKGLVHMTDSANALIYASKVADFSTFAHEMAHVAQDAMTGDLRSMTEEAFGVVDSQWTVAAKEAFASGFERYLREGFAQTEQHRTIFQRISDWMKSIYPHMRSRWQVNEKTAAVYDAMLGLREPQSPKAPHKVNSIDGKVVTRMSDSSFDAVRADGSSAASIVFERSGDVVSIAGTILDDAGYDGVIDRLMEQFIAENPDASFDITNADDQTAQSFARTFAYVTGEDSALSQRVFQGDIYNTLLQRRDTAQVSFEAIPGSWAWASSLSYQQQQQLLSAIDAVMKKRDAYSELGKILGVEVEVGVEAPGVWKDQRNPSMQLIVKPGVDPKMVDAYAAVLGRLLKQDGVGWHETISGEGQNVGIDIGRVPAVEEVAAMAKAMDAEFGESFAIASSEDGIHVLNFSGDDINDRVLELWNESTGVKASSFRFGGNGNLVENDWSTHPNGEAYTETARSVGDAGSKAIAWADQNLKADIDAVYSRFAESQGQTLLQKTAYHGSGAMFDKFSAKYLGTGVGKQALGWGLYFAERREIAERYARQIGASTGTKALYKAILFEGDSETLIDYRGKIPPQIANMVRKSKAITEALGKKAEVIGNLTGEEFYHELSKRVGSDYLASKLLLKAGVDGIKMADPESRMEGGPVKNIFVVFDTRHIKIDEVKTLQQGKAPKGDAFWYKMGDSRGVDSTHISDVIANPSVYGLTREQIDEIYARHGEKIGQEGDAREEVIRSIVGGGWMRIRHYRKPKDFWSLTVRNADDQRKMIDTFLLYAVDDMTLGLNDELQIYSTETNSTESYSFMKGGVKGYFKSRFDESQTLKQPLSQRERDALSVGTRAPWAVKATEDPVTTRTTIGIAEMREAGELFEANVGLMTSLHDSYPMFESLAGAPADQAVGPIIDLMKGNLEFLYSLVPNAAMRKKMSRWYDGAHNIALKFSDSYGFSASQVAAAIAATSPQKDWNENVGIAERVIDIVANQYAIPWDQEMTDAYNALSSPEFDKIKELIFGKRFEELSSTGEKAAWVRVYDKAKNPRRYRLISPDGTLLDYAEAIDKPATKSREATYRDSNIRWGSLYEISGAISVLEDGSLKTISSAIGSNHKVRNFYNNIINPNSKNAEVTIDTHAAAAALMLPLSGANEPVLHVFGSRVTGRPGPKNNSVVGVSGTYGIYADAYRQAAEELGVLPRQLQSIVWEVVRNLFSREQKKAGNLIGEASEQWGRYDGRNAADIRSAISERAGGFSAPSWWNDKPPAQGWGSTFREELDLSELPGQQAGAGRGSEGTAGRGSRTLLQGRGLGGLRGGEDVNASEAVASAYQASAALALSYNQGADRVLDYGAGEGYGGEALREIGIRSDSYEPVHSGAVPTFRESSIPEKYQAIIVHHILDDMDPEMLQASVRHIAGLLDQDGVAIVNVAKKKGYSSATQLATVLNSYTADDVVVDVSHTQIDGMTLVMKRVAQAPSKNVRSPVTLNQGDLFIADINYAQEFQASNGAYHGIRFANEHRAAFVDFANKNFEINRTSLKKNQIVQMLKQLSSDLLSVVFEDGEITGRSILNAERFIYHDLSGEISQERRSGLNRDLKIIGDIKRAAGRSVLNVLIFKGRISEEVNVLDAGKQVDYESVVKPVAKALEEIGAKNIAEEVRSRRASGNLDASDLYNLVSQAFELLGDRQSGRTRASKLLSFVGIDGIRDGNWTTMFRPDAVVVEAVTLLQESEPVKVSRNGVNKAIRSGEFIPMSTLELMADDPTVEAEIYRRKVLFAQASELTPFDDFLEDASAADGYDRPSDYYRGVWDEAQAARNGIDPVILNDRFLSAVDEDILTILLGDVAAVNREHDLPNGLAEAARKVRQGKKLTKTDLQGAMSALKKNAGQVRALMSDLPAEFDSRAFVELVMSELGVSDVEAGAPVLEHETGRSVSGQLERARSRLSAAEEALSSARDESSLQSREARKRLAVEVSRAREELRTWYAKKARIDYLIRKIMRRPSRSVAVGEANRILEIQSRYNPKITQKMKELIDASRRAQMVETNATIKSILNEKLSRVDMQDLKLSALEELSGTIDAITQEGREKYKSAAKAESDLIHSVRAEMIRINGGENFSGVTGKGSVEAKRATRTGALKGVQLASLRPERIAQLLGGDQKTVFYEWFWENINKAINERLENVDRRTEAGYAEMKRLGIRARDLGKTITIDGLTFTYDDVISLYVGIQDEYSYDALIHGNRISPETISRFVSSLPENMKKWGDWMIDSFSGGEFQRLQEVFVKDTNTTATKVERYFPMLRRDVLYSDAINQVADDLLSRHGRAPTNIQKGFMVSRVNISPEHQTPLRLGATQIWGEQIDKQEHYISHGILIKRLNRVMRNGALREAIAENHGSGAIKWIETYIQDVSHPDLYDVHDNLRSVSKWLRNNVQIAALTFNALTAFRQLPSVALYLPYSGPGYLLASAAKFAARPGYYMSMVSSLDPQVKHRTINREDAEMRSISKNPVMRARDKVANFGMAPVRFMDRVAVTIGWNAVYEKAKAMGASEQEAIWAAQNATLKTQPAGRAKDLAQIYRGPEAYNWFLMFTNQLNQNWNMMTYDMWHGEPGHRIANALAVAVSLGISAAVISAVNNVGRDDEDKEYARDLLSSLMSSVPFLGSGIKSGMEGWLGGGVNPMPAAVDFGRLLAELSSGEVDWDGALETSGRLLMEATKTLGVPGTVAVTRGARSAAEMMESGEWEPDFLVKVLTGR